MLHSSICRSCRTSGWDSGIDIGHDLSMERHISDRVTVMYPGNIAELTARDTLYNDPWRPYAQGLLLAVAVPDPAFKRQRQHLLLESALSSPANPPPGCNFNTRRSAVMDTCIEVEPEFGRVSVGCLSATLSKTTRHRQAVPICCETYVLTSCNQALDCGGLNQVHVSNIPFSGSSGSVQPLTVNIRCGILVLSFA